MRDTVYRRYVRIPYIRVNEGSLIQRNICNIPLVYSTVQYLHTYNVQNKAMVQLFVTHFSDKISSYETELAEPPKRQHGEKSHLESAE